MKALILCGGQGTRLRPLTFAVPKPLLPIGNITILETVLMYLKSQGVQEVAISLGWRAEVVRSYLGKSRFGFDLHYVEDTKPLGTAGPLTLVKDWIGSEPLFVMNGDILTKLDLKKLLDFHQEHNSGLTVCVRDHVTKSRFGVVYPVKNHPTALQRIVEKPEYHELVSAGMYVVSPGAIKLIPPLTSYTMPQLAYDCSASNDYDQNQPHVYKFDEPWEAVETLEDLDRVGNDSKWLSHVEQLSLRYSVK